MPIETQHPSGATLHEVKGDDSTLLDIACQLFAEIFPEDIRYIPYLRACAEGTHPSHPKTYDHVWLIQLNGKWVGVRIFSYITTRSFGHGAYIGFLPEVRSLGLGAWIAQQTINQLEDDAHRFGHEHSLGYLVEVERPIDAETEEEYWHNEKRLKFHRQCGGIVIPVPFTEPIMIRGVDYITEEELQGEEARPMHLVLIPSTFGASLRNLNVKDLLYGIYLDVYLLDKSHPFVQNALSYLE